MPAPFAPQPETTMNVYLAWTGTILWWICWPVGIVLYYLFIAVVAILKLIYWPIAFILQPVVYLFRFIGACLALPFRALVKLEVSRLNLLRLVTYLITHFLASVQLHRRRSARGPPWWAGSVLYL